MEQEYTKKQQRKQYDWLKAYQWKKGQSGNPKGRPPGKSLKTFAKEMLQSLPEEEKIEFLKTIEPRIVWEMAEGKAKQENEVTGTLTISEVLDSLDDGQKDIK